MNASTDYSWRLARPLDEGVVGLTSFRAVAAGRTTISLEYVLPWLSPAPPAQTADFTVIVE